MAKVIEKDEEKTEFDTLADIERRNDLLKGVAPETIRKAWFTLSHLLLDDGAHVVDMGCDDGSTTYVMAALNPKIKFTGLEKNKRLINQAKAKYQLHNLDYKIGDTSREIFEPNSLDAIINSYVLHEVYSSSRYNLSIVRETLETHFKALKEKGVMFIRDYARPPPEEFVLLEMPDKPSKGHSLDKLSEPDLLLWYSEHARPRQDPGCGGFFLEELPERFPDTRLFRLPYKWAYEFIMRKDDRKHWETELPVEYTFFTKREFRQQLRGLGARVQYSGPYWDEDIIEQKFDGHFRLFDDSGKPLGNPPTCYVAVAHKMAERKSLNIEERRPTKTDNNSLEIKAMRNEKTGEISDVVTRGINLHEFIPYRVDENGKLKIYLHDGVARSIANAVPRNGALLDDKRWSGHMVEPISVDDEAIGSLDSIDIKNTEKFAKNYLGLKPKSDAIIQRGPDYYPAPDYIDERIFTYYLNVKRNTKYIIPKHSVEHAERFQAKGVIREFDAQQILNAITVGLIPNARLELQILCLFNKLNIKAESWTTKQMIFQVAKLQQPKSVKDLLKDYGQDDVKFKEIKGSTGELRTVHSTFVEEGQTRGIVSGLSSQNVDFVVFDDKTINTAVVLPLTKGLKQQVHAGFQIKHLPIPQRHEGNGLTMAAPSYDLPREITNMKMAKKFLADKFGVAPEMVIRLGESYYSHVGVTPQRIFPFAISVPPSAMKAPDTKFLPFYQLRLLRSYLARDTHFMVLIARAYQYLHDELRLDAKIKVKSILKDRFEYQRPEWSTPLDFHRAPALPSSKGIDIAVEEALNRDVIDQKMKEKAEQKRETAIEKKNKEAQEKAAEALKKIAPNLSEEFEIELEEFLEELEDVPELIPRPEKW